MGQVMEIVAYLQTKMELTATDKGLAHADVLSISQRLDQYIIQIQRARLTSSRSFSDDQYLDIKQCALHHSRLSHQA